MPDAPSKLSSGRRAGPGHKNAGAGDVSVDNKSEEDYHAHIES